MSMILDAFVGKCVDRLLSFIEEKAVMMLGVKEDLKKLLRTMVRIQKVLEDAERRRLEDSAINNWVNELKDIMYDAEDILDLSLIEGSQLLDEHPFSSSNPSCNFSCFSCFLGAPHRYEIGERINSINSRLEEIYKDRLQFNLDHQNTKTNLTTVNSHQTSPVIAELEVVGREIEDATKDMIKLMIRGEMRKFSVFAITGMGGIGKTTLAQKIFNHKKVQTKFQIKLWVCVSQNYNEIDLLKQVIRGAMVSYGDANTKAELEPLLRSAVSGKSVFLVLDDVWRADVWIDLLRSPLHSALIDSLILITSRDENVAKQMGSVYIHPVIQLPVETGWEMLTRRLVIIGGREEDIYNLRELGIQIVEKCHGVPLAIKAMAGVLAKKEPIAKEWRKILNNYAWNMNKLPEEIRGALYLSYDDLPSPLKQCFHYCSLFPEDWILFREDLVRLWVAEGFIKEEGDSLMEDTAQEYFHELTSRNVLQLNLLSYDGNSCKMHDLFRVLAQFISRDESFSGNVIEKSTIPFRKLRRLALTGQGNATVVLDAITEPKCLRTLFIFSGFQALDFNQLARFLNLRVLDLTENEIESIPNFIGDLIHLRHLDLDRSHIRDLPESIGRLSNLQFLSLCGCKYLTYLPQSITQLQNLRRLALLDTPLSFIPKGIERLKQLNGLKGFVVGDDRISDLVGGEQVIMHSTLKDLSSLSKLSILNVYNLERARSGSLVLRELSRLKELQLSCSPVHSNEENNSEKEIVLIEKLFEELVPPKSLEELYIKCYFGNSYPKWLMSLSLGSYLPYLSILDLVDNISSPLPPPLGQLPSLRILYIAGGNAVKSIGPEFLGGGVVAARSENKIAFPLLQLLTIHRMENLHEWFFSYDEDNDGSQELVLFPRLHELIIIDCPKLRSLPGGLGRTGLKKLYVTGANSLKELDNLTHLAEWIDLHENQSLERISNLPLLKCLTVRKCYALKCVESLDRLQQLELVDDSMDCLPEWLQRFIEELLRGREAQDDGDDFLLQLWCNERVLRRCRRGGEDWAFIQHIPRLNAYSTQGEGYLRFVKLPFCYETNI
ncbi:hypothetical protein M5K25_024691 [Dendrobium thyrsiflorum]|uniref:Disease resistance protein RGA3 n=1 Tax=Dendrobium thyrsiflorum TaxID=117978 RepID=A0ABD0U2J2_DENTH